MESHREGLTINHQERACDDHLQFLIIPHSSVTPVLSPFTDHLRHMCSRHYRLYGRLDAAYELNTALAKKASFGT